MQGGAFKLFVLPDQPFKTQIDYNYKDLNQKKNHILTSEKLKQAIILMSCVIKDAKEENVIINFLLIY